MNPWDILPWAVAFSAAAIIVALGVFVIVALVIGIRRGMK